MEIVKIPSMDKAEYDKLIEEGFVSRIAFQGGKYPYIAPFLYVFDGKFLYFLATKYGRKNDLFRQHPYVSVEIEKYSGDLSCYTFVTMQGYLVQLEDAIEKKIVREKFVDMIKAHNRLPEHPCRARSQARRAARVDRLRGTLKHLETYRRDRYRRLKEPLTHFVTTHF